MTSRVKVAIPIEKGWVEMYREMYLKPGGETRSTNYHFLKKKKKYSIEERRKERRKERKEEKRKGRKKEGKR